MTGNQSTHILTFPEFVHLIAEPGSPFQNVHWRPQHLFCGLQKFVDRFNFVGNMERLQPQSELLLKATDLWERFGKTGWGGPNVSMFQTNQVQRKNIKLKYTCFQQYNIDDTFEYIY